MRLYIQAQLCLKVNAKSMLSCSQRNANMIILSRSDVYHVHWLSVLQCEHWLINNKHSMGEADGNVINLAGIYLQ